MNLLKNRKLGTKVFVGFGMILGLLILSVIIALLSMQNFNRHFNEYAEISTDEMLVGRIQANLLETRLAAENFIQYGDAAQRELFDARFNKMQGFIFELKANISNSEVQMIMEQILERSREYKDDFDKIVTLDDRRAALYETLTIKGPELEGNLTQVLEAAYLKQEVTLIYRAGNALKHLLSARLQVSRFLELNDLERIAQVKKEFKEMDNWITLIQNASDSHEAEILRLVETNKEIYMESFAEVALVIEDRNRAIGHLDKIGPEVSAIAEEIKLFIIEEQEGYKPRIRQEYQLMITRMAILSILAVLLAIAVSVRIIKIVIFPVNTVTDTFKDIVEDEADLAVRLSVNSQDELGRMAKYFNKFMGKLQVIIAENKNQSWLKTGEAELSAQMNGEENLKTLGTNVINYLAEYLKASIGRLYLKNENGSYELQAQYACLEEDFINAIKIGEGIVGQAALEKQSIKISQVPDNYLKIKSGLGESSPKSIIVVPCVMNNETIGIIELGSFSDFTPLEIKFLDEVSGTIAIIVNSLKSHIKLQELLHKTIIQSEELQVQQEELRQSNEEFEQQTRALKESEERLKEQQEALRAINQEVVEHSRQLESQRNDIKKKNENLLKAKKEIQDKAEALEEANKYKSEFLANMSHELRTPLNSILVLSELLANKKDNTPLTEKQLEFASTIHSSGSELLKLINDILDLSKMEVGKMDVYLEPMDLEELARSMEKTFGQIAENKGLTFEVSVAEGLPKSIITDAQKVKQITNNLLSNAFKFTESGKVVLKVDYPNQAVLPNAAADLKDAICISVSDTGIGVPEEKQSIIFEAFKQSDGTISRKYGGTGLGLSITKEFAKLLGGSIHLTSKENEGSLFTLVLPMERPQALSVKEEERVEEAGGTPEMPEVPVTEDMQKAADEKSKSARTEKLLLIIEDEADFAQVLRELAQHRGYQCMIAANGSEGIRLAKEHLPDAILLDIDLPDMSGWQVAEELKERCETNMPIHVLSGGDIADGMQMTDTIVGYMQKPVSLEKLNEVFKSIDTSFGAPIKKILTVGIDTKEKQEIDKMLGQGEIKIVSSEAGTEAIKRLEVEAFDCIILDFKLKDMTGFAFLDKLKAEEVANIPIIIYTERKFTEDDADRLRKYVQSIIIKGRKSIERLTAEVNLFLHQLEDNNNLQRHKRIRSSQEKEEALKGRKILIVDDDMRNVFALSSILEEKGIHIIVGKNGEEGLNKLNEHPDIDLILMDIMMPKMDGYEAMKQIRANKNFSKIPIIALTAKAMKEDREKCIEAGANDYLTKPIQIDRLLSLIRVWLYK